MLLYIKEKSMFQLSQSIGALGLCLALTATAGADGPVFDPPHGLLVVDVDDANQLFSNTATGEFDNNMITTNALGQTILTHDKRGIEFSGGGVTIYPGGIAERDGDAPTTPASPASTILLADDPGFFVAANTFPAEYVLSVTFADTLRHYDGSNWSPVPNGEQFRVFDLEPGNTGGAPVFDLDFIIDGSGASGGAITIGKAAGDPNSGNVSSIHGHVGYELSRPDGQVPAFGAYMVELQLSSFEHPAAGGEDLIDSEPIFVIFENQSEEISDTYFADAVSAAESLPEPTSAILLTAAGLGLLGVRARRSAPTPEDGAPLRVDVRI